MKSIFLAIFLMFMVPPTCYAQSFILAGDDGPLSNGAVIVLSGPSDTLQLITWLHITNQTVNDVNVMMKKQELSMLPGGSSSICWAGYCYGPEMTVSTFPLSMAPGDTVSGCFGHFGPNGSRGVSVIRWVFYNETNPSDSLSITVHYSTFPSATEPIQMPQVSFSVASLVPADDHIVFRYSMPPGTRGFIEICNQAGKSISESELVSPLGSLTVKTTALPSGIYYFTLVTEGKFRLTRKVIVFHC